MISIDELERAAADGWPGIEAEPPGGWLLRAAEGFTGRANGALAAGDPGYRGRLLGTAVTAALAAAALRRRAVRWLYLQVEDDNAAALARYAKIGFSDHHGYHYRVAPASS